MRRRKDRKQVDIASRTSSKNRQLDGAFLDGTESSVIEIEATASKGFQEAWAQSVDGESDQSLDSAISVGQDDTRARSLEGSRTGAYLGVAGLVVAIVAVAFFATQAATAPDPNIGARASADTERNVLTSPLAEREYTDLVTPVAVANTGMLDQRFVATGGELVPDDSASEDRDILFGPVFWAGRTHVVVMAEATLVAPEDECLIVSLVAEDLRAIDVAGVGQCSDSFAATGDRIACESENVALVEVWPFNPDSVTEPKTVAAIRTRLERTSGAEVSSLRGALSVADDAGTSPVLAAATTLEGRPGDTVTIQLGDFSGECALVDRSTVDVRLLPG